MPAGNRQAHFEVDRNIAELTIEPYIAQAQCIRLQIEFARQRVTPRSNVDLLDPGNQLLKSRPGSVEVEMCTCKPASGNEDAVHGDLGLSERALEIAELHPPAIERYVDSDVDRQRRDASCQIKPTRYCRKIHYLRGEL